MAVQTLMGVDGCKAGWVIAASDLQLSTICFGIAERIDRLIGAAAQAQDTLILIDIPIGLPADGPRACDVAARRLLGRARAGSVFPVPCRAALTADTHAAASQLNRTVCGRGVPAQAFCLFSKLREVDAAMSRDRQQWIRETHPEVTFALLSGCGRGLPWSKKDPRGLAARLALLSRFLPAMELQEGVPPRCRSPIRYGALGSAAPSSQEGMPLRCCEPIAGKGRLSPEIDVRAIRQGLGVQRVLPDDIVDALAALVSAHRVWADEATVLPAGRPAEDERGLRMEIVA